MSSLKCFLLVAAFCSCSNLGHGDTITTPKPVYIDVPKPPSNLEVLPSPVAVVAAASVPSAPHAEAAVPSAAAAEEVAVPRAAAAAEADVDTTNQETTTASVPTTTDAPITTVPPAPPTPTPAPGPVPPPDQGKWSFFDNKQNVTCIMVQFAAQLNVTYGQGVNGSLAHVLVNVPANATVAGGSCNTTEQWIELTWYPKNMSSEAGNNTMKLVFYANDTTKMYEFKGLNVSLNPEILVNATNNATIELWHGKAWEVPLANSYQCSPAKELKLTSTDLAAVLTVSKLQAEAFRKTAAEGFSAARECGGGDVPDAVPIAVGCALGGLVVVVLVAYLVARRRSAARGYLSM